MVSGAKQKVYAAGTNNYGQLGLGHKVNQESFAHVAALDGKYVRIARMSRERFILVSFFARLIFLFIGGKGHWWRAPLPSVTGGRNGFIFRKVLLPITLVMIVFHDCSM